MRALTSPTSIAGIQVSVLVALLGALAGIGIAVATDVVSRTSVGGQNWSLSGNGALVVLFSGVPAVLAGGWGALARWRLRDGRWGTVGVSLGLVALAAAGLASFGPVLAVNTFGEEALRGGDGSLAAIGITFFAPAALGFVGGLGVALVLGGMSLVAVVVELVLVGLVVGLVVSPWRVAYFLVGPLLVVPGLVSLPVMLMSDRRGRVFGRGWLVGACVCLVVGVVAGMVGAQQVQGL